MLTKDRRVYINDEKWGLKWCCLRRIELGQNLSGRNENRNVILGKTESLNYAKRRLSRDFDIPLPQDVLNIENKLRSNLFAWRGQFSPQLIEALLDAYSEPNAVLLDPFMGSGTVLVEAARQGRAVFGVEVNPAAYSIARLYEFCSVPPDIRSRELREAEEFLRPILEYGLPLFGAEYHAPEFDLSTLAAVSARPRVCALIEAVIVLGDANGETQQGNIHRQRWFEIKKLIASLPLIEKPVQALFGDARQIDLPDNSIDLVISSPPYINVFNYHHNYRFSVEALGWKPLVVARSEIGSNRKFRQNRYLTVVQYCIDMALVLAEIRRLGRESLRVVLIVGRESNVQKTPFFNGEIVESLANQIAGFQTILKQQRVFTNRFGQAIYEDLLHLEPHSESFEMNQIVSRARILGQRILFDARVRVPSDKLVDFEDALSVASEVTPSPVLVANAARRTYKA